MKSFIEIENLKKIYTMGEIEVKAADGINLNIEKGEFVVIVGPSGAGKTTVLNILGGMDNLTSGTIIVDGIDISQFNEYQLSTYRRYDIGFVFQFYNLIQNLTALENVELASQITKNQKNLSANSFIDAKQLLNNVGLSDRMNNFPSQLSGGEQQRVSIARALAKNPKLLLCDEPTGALDDVTGKAVLELLHNTCKTLNMTVIIITHNQAITPLADRVIQIRNGRVAKMEINPNPLPIERIEW